MKILTVLFREEAHLLMYSPFYFYYTLITSLNIIPIMPQNDFTIYYFFLTFVVGPLVTFTWVSILFSNKFFIVFNFIKKNQYLTIFRIIKLLKITPEGKNKALFIPLSILPTTGDLGFQNAATGLMESLITLHHDIMYFEIVILTAVMFFFCFIIFWYTKTPYSFFANNPKLTMSLKKLSLNKHSLVFTHAAFLEIVWTTFPALLLICIAIPSILLIFRTGKVTASIVTIKCVGNQWFWHFDYIACSTDTTNILSAYA